MKCCIVGKELFTYLKFEENFKAQRFHFQKLLQMQTFFMLLSVFASNWETGDHDGVKSNRECSNSIERWALDSISIS